MSSNYVVELEKDEVIQGSHKNNKNDEVTEDGDFITGLDTRSNKANDSIDSLNRQHTWIERMANRKSIIELIHGPKLSRRDSVVVYGKTFLIDNNLRWRIRHGQRISLVFAFLGVILNIFKSYSWIISVMVMFCAIPVISALFLLYYKNISFVVVKKLFKESNVIIIVSLSVFNLIISIFKPDDGRSFLFDVYIFLFVNLFVFIDALRVKSRIFVLVIGILFIIMMVTNFWRVTMGNGGMNIILVSYEYDNKEYFILKRPTQRSIFTQTLLFSVSGLYTLFRDVDLELMIFCKGNIYRDTGTTSRLVEDSNYSRSKSLEEGRSVGRSSASKA